MSLLNRASGLVGVAVRAAARTPTPIVLRSGSVSIGQRIPFSTESTGDRTGLGTVADILAAKGEKFYYTRSDALVIEAVKLMVSHNIGSLIIVDDSEKPIGIVTERDYMEKVIVRGRSSHNTHVKDIMSEKEFTYVTPATPLTDCMEKMSAMRIRHLPVIEQGKSKVLGMLSVGDIMKELSAAHKKNADHMRDFISGSY